ncbi:MAG TPA: hypothetical protein VHV83_03320, partial [Armatimonadota bacterium]|nr:hypothetical protein [Armatimonadota bacterium]
ILTDVQRRKKYDASLPTKEPEPQRISDLAELWQMAGKLFFEQSERFTPAVDAMRLSRPVILDDDKLLVVGLDPTKASLAGYLAPAITHNHVRRIISELYGKPIDFRVITGFSVEEWKDIKEAEEKIRQRRKGNQRPLPQLNGNTAPSEANFTPSTNPDEAWDDVMETIVKQWSATETRAYPQSRARFAIDQLQIIARAEDISRAVGMPDDVLQKNIARSIDRISSLSGIESGAIALDYLRLRSRILGGI